MRHIYVRVMMALALVILVLPASAQERGQVRFFDSLYDVPVLADLEEVPEMALTYDKQSGRISTAVATSQKANVEGVYALYRDTLPRFGWKLIGLNSYVREGEKLEITHEALDNTWLIQFSLKPALAK